MESEFKNQPELDKLISDNKLMRLALEEIIEEEITDFNSDDWCPCADMARNALDSCDENLNI